MDSRASRSHNRGVSDLEAVLDQRAAAGEFGCALIEDRRAGLNAPSLEFLSDGSFRKQRPDPNRWWSACAFKPDKTIIGATDELHGGPDVRDQVLQQLLDQLDDVAGLSAGD
jgi:predicted amidohydrolase